MKLKLPSFLENMGTGDNINFEFPFFILYLRAITSGTLSRLAMIKFAGEKPIFKNISIYLNKILYLTEQWRYPQSKAAELISAEAPTEYFSTFLYKLSQSISAGEPTNEFIQREHKNWLAEYEAKRNRDLDRLKMLSDAYLPMLSVTLFLTTTMLISTIFYDAESMILLTMVSVVLISFILYLISWMIYKAALPDSVLISEQTEKTRRRIKIERFLYICLGLSAVVTFIPMNRFIKISIVGFLFTISGFAGRHYLGKVKEKEHDYPTFFRYISGNLAVDIPLLDVVKAATESNFGSLNTPIRSLYNKLSMRIQPMEAWWSFETELDSKLIRRMNLIMTDTFYTGGDLSKSMKFMEEFLHIYTKLRNKRYQAVSYHTGILVPMYVIMACMFSVIDGFFTALTGFIGELSGMMTFMSVPPMDFIRLFFTFTLILFALNNAYSVYNMEGDSRFTVVFYTGIQMCLGGFAYYYLSGLVANSLGSVSTL